MACWGRECKLGWGYNESLNRLIPVQGQPPNVTSTNLNRWGDPWYPYTVSSTDIQCWPWISLLLEPSYKKFLDLQIVVDHNQYWLVRCQFGRRTERSGKLPQYPPNCSYFVDGICYGVDLWVLFPKVGFPERVRELFKERNFDETQKKTKCRVFINYNEIREITLQELSNFMKELEEEKHSQYDIPVLFWYGGLPQEVRGTVISNQTQFKEFLSYLYCVYRKIEIKMKKAGYPDILSDLDSNEVSLDKIRTNLNKAKEDYESIDKNDFLKMYPVLKKLFFSYTDYIRYCMDNLIDMNEGDHLPGTIEEIKPWLQQLDTWVSLVIALPPGYQQIIQTLQKTNKSSNSRIINDNQALEPYIRGYNKKILFGFIDMKGAEKSIIPNDAAVFESECPEECTKDVRKWMCLNCGNFVSHKVMTLFCSCGSKKYKEKLLTCHHLSHRSEKPKERQTPAFNPDDLLPSICRQLEQIQIRTEGTTDRRILIAITCFTNKRIEQIEASLRELQDVSLDANTRHMINLYLNRNR